MIKQLTTLQATFAKGRSASALSVSSASARQDTIEEELDERRPSVSHALHASHAAHAAHAAHASHDAALAELRRDVRNEVQRLQQKVIRMFSRYYTVDHEQ